MREAADVATVSVPAGIQVRWQAAHQATCPTASVTTLTSVDPQCGQLNERAYMPKTPGEARRTLRGCRGEVYYPEV